MRAVGCPEDVLPGRHRPRRDRRRARSTRSTSSCSPARSRTGRKVAAKAAESLTPFSLELGGKDPMIVLRDADLERAANAAVYWSMANGGQICQSVERVYVEEPVYDEFVSKVVEKTQGAPAGRARRARRPSTSGAVTFEHAGRDHRGPREGRGRRRARRSCTGGKRREGAGPLLRADRPHGRGPLDEDHDRGDLRADAADHEGARRGRGASRRRTTRATGSTRASSRKDVEKGERIARRIEAGSTCVNDCITNYTAQELPFGGVDESGIGVRHWRQGIQKYCNPHSILITRFAGQARAVLLPVLEARDEAARAPDGADVRARLQEALAARRSPRTRGHALVGRVRLPRRADDPADGRARGDRDLADRRARR